MQRKLKGKFGKVAMAVSVAAMGWASGSGAAGFYVGFSGQTNKNPDAFSSATLNCVVNSSQSSCNKPVYVTTYNYIVGNEPEAHLLYVEPLLINDAVIPISANARTPILSGWSPAVAGFNGQLFAAYQEFGTSKIRYGWSSDTVNWSTIGTGLFAELSGHRTASKPHLQAFKGRLYVSFEGLASEQIYTASTADGVNWTPAVAMSGVETNITPILTVFNNKMYMFYRGNASKNIWYRYTSDGTNWSPQVRIGNHETSHSPYPTVHNNTLYVAFKGGSSESLYLMSSTDGVNYSSPIKPDAGWKTDSGPAIASYNGKLYYVFRGTASNRVLYSASSNGVTWPTPVHRVGSHTSGSPTLAVY